ncbi:hypothetical protein ACLKA7_001386 [Drosophila subpalustris]
MSQAPICSHLIWEELTSLRKEVKDMKEQICQNSKMMVKMTEEILAVKLEARKHRQDSTYFEVFDSKHLPLSTKEALEEFEKTIEENEEKLHKFKLAASTKAPKLYFAAIDASPSVRQRFKRALHNLLTLGFQ